MSHNLALPTGGHLARRHRPAALLAVAAARVLAGRSPHRIQQVLRLVRRGACPATAAQASAARSAVTAVSRRCAIDRGCLQRSLAAALLCRLRGTWPTWCTGVRTTPFFSAHAWIAVDGEPIDEPHDPAYYTPVLAVPPQHTW
ncbi:lasso peptide biosynthesis B2 protein [Nonomuraea sp. NPDC003560]|uniref:lasso peptide biosynthesis B2 protein n=1 Tax=Nonomuraea sp. NPDC003560 TaxID=3364341 RepID=UPI0036C3756C